MSETPTIYSDSVKIEFSIFDIRLKFGVGQGEAWRSLTDVVLSPQHLKVLAPILAEHIRRYEERFGPIPVEGSRPKEPRHAWGEGQSDE